jgi:hypothetical protein
MDHAFLSARNSLSSPLKHPCETTCAVAGGEWNSPGGERAKKPNLKPTYLEGPASFYSGSSPKSSGTKESSLVRHTSMVVGRLHLPLRSGVPVVCDLS